jgi:hypothetical protein
MKKSLSKTYTQKDIDDARTAYINAVNCKENFDSMLRRYVWRSTTDPVYYKHYNTLIKLQEMAWRALRRVERYTARFEMQHGERAVCEGVYASYHPKFLPLGFWDDADDGVPETSLKPVALHPPLGKRIRQAAVVALLEQLSEEI